MKGLLYFARNSAFQHLMKIGKTKNLDDVERRGLTSSNVPEDFDYPAVFECDDMAWAEKKLHEQFAAYRHTSTTGRKTEFFWSGCVDAAIKYARDLKGVVEVTSNLTEEIEVNKNGEKEKKRIPNTTFEMIKLPVGTEILFHGDSKQRAVVKDKKNKVEYNGKAGSISAIAKSILKREANGFEHFTYKGKPLFDMRPDRQG
jgi:hypothetical protein